MTDDQDIEIIDGDGADGDDEGGRSLTDLVEQPAKVMRIGTMIKQLLEEVRAAPLDEASRSRLRDIHRISIRELEDGLAPELRDELERLTLPFTEESTPSDAELRIAQARVIFHFSPQIPQPRRVIEVKHQPMFMALPPNGFHFSADFCTWIESESSGLYSVDTPSLPRRCSFS